MTTSSSSSTSTAPTSTEYYDDQLTSSTATSSPSPRAASPPAIDAELALGGHLSGTVTDSAGNGLGGIEIELARARATASGPASARSSASSPTTTAPTRSTACRPARGESASATTEGNYLYRVLRRRRGVREATDIERARRRDDRPASTPSSTTPPTSRAPSPTRTATRSPGHLACWRALEDGNWEIAGEPRPPRTAPTPSTGSRPARLPHRVPSRTGEYATEFYDDAITDRRRRPRAGSTTGETVGDIDAQLAGAAHITGDGHRPRRQPYDIVGRRGVALDGHAWEDYSLEFAETTTRRRRRDTTTSADWSPAPTGWSSTRSTTPPGNSEAGHEFWNDQPSLELGPGHRGHRARARCSTGTTPCSSAGQYPNEVENLTPPAITGHARRRPDPDGLAGHLEPRRARPSATSGSRVRRPSAPTRRRTPRPRPTSARRSPSPWSASVAGLGSAAATSAPTAAVTAPR